MHRIAVDIKEPGEKLLRLRITLNGKGTILRFILGGDFFIYPEELVETLEESINGLVFSEEKVFTQVNHWHTENSPTLVGVSLESIQKAVTQAHEQYRSSYN